jgi:recombination protein RecA
MGSLSGKSKFNSFDEFRKAAQKAYGDAAFASMREISMFKRIPTGITALDIATGGGWVVGQINLVWGRKSSGKTSLMLRAIANAQKLCRHDAKFLGDPALELTSDLPTEPVYRDKAGNVVSAEEALVEVDEVTDGMEVEKKVELKDGFSVDLYQEPMRALIINAEQVFDPWWAARLGVNDEYTHLFSPECAEDAIDLVDAAIRNRSVDIILVDSLAMLTPRVESEESSHKNQQALLPRILSKGMRMWVSALATYSPTEVRPTILLVNQVREKVGVMYGNPEVKPGGHAPEFATCLEVKLRHAPPVKDQDFAPESVGGHLLVQRTNFEVVWNKTFPRGYKGQYLMAISPFKDYVPGDIVQDAQHIDLFKRYGILEKEKSKWRFGDLVFSSQKELLAWARENPLEFEFYRYALVSAATGVIRGS